LLVNILSPLGFEVQEAADGEQAIAVWLRWQPHLIWMDMRMPVMDGYEATRRIKATPQGQQTVIIALTASALEEDRAVILAEGCDDYIRKPFREKDLFEALTKHLGVRFAYETPPQGTGDMLVSLQNGQGEVLQSSSAATIAERLSRLPPDLVHGLRRAVVLGYWDQAQIQIDRICELDPQLGLVFSDLARLFDQSRILEYLDSQNQPISTLPD
jgi:CheY-like chemotaxis protein